MYTLGEYFFLAANTGLVNDVERALELGASPNWIDDAGFPVLHLGVLSNEPKIIKLLVERGADLNAKDDQGRTALELGAETGRWAAVSALLNAKSDASFIMSDGRSLLHALCTDDRWMMIHQAIELGSPIHHRDSQGRTALQISALGGHHRSVRVLLACGASFSDLEEPAMVLRFKDRPLSSEVQKVVNAWRAALSLSAIR